jgi:hypothetical protein
VDVDLVEVVVRQVGRPMVLLINLYVPVVCFTARASTPVVRIDPIPEELVRQ